MPIKGMTFDHINTTWLSKRFNCIGSPTVVSSTGRGSTKAVSVNSSNSIGEVFTATDTPMFCGGFYLPSLPGIGSYSTLVTFYDATSEQVRVVILGDGTIGAERGGNNGLGPVSSWAALAGTYYGFTARFTIHGTAGTCHIYINGNPTPILSFTGVNTKATANASVNSWRLGGRAGDVTTYWKDVCWDDDGVFVGDPKVLAQFGTGDDTLTLTPSSGSTAYPLLDESPPDMTDKVTGTSGKVLLTFDPLPIHPESIYAVGTEVAINKDDTGARFWKDLYKISSTEYAGTAEDMSTDALLLTQWRWADPSTSDDWTESGLNAAKQGLEIT